MPTKRVAYSTIQVLETDPSGWTFARNTSVLRSVKGSRPAMQLAAANRSPRAPAPRVGCQLGSSGPRLRRSLSVCICVLCCGLTQVPPPIEPAQAQRPATGPARKHQPGTGNAGLKSIPQVPAEFLLLGSGGATSTSDAASASRASASATCAAPASARDSRGRMKGDASCKAGDAGERRSKPRWCPVWGPWSRLGHALLRSLSDRRTEPRHRAPPQGPAGQRLSCGVSRGLSGQRARSRAPALHFR